MIVPLTIIALEIAAGILLAWMSRDELRDGRIWFIFLMIASFFAGAWFAIQGDEYIVLSLLFVFIASLVAYVKSFDGKWTKRRV